MSDSDALKRQRLDLQAEKREQSDTADTEPANLTLLPLRHSKIIHLVRHGQGFHNVAGEVTQELYCDETYFDAHLTARGWQQAGDLKAHAKTSDARIKPEIVIVSPLMRAMQTAAAAFGGGKWQEGDTTAQLMTEGSEQKEISAAHSAIAQSEVPFVAFELCREHIGKHPCDRRRPLEEYRKKFPGIDFSNVLNEDDIYWKAGQRESDADIAKRGIEFLQWLSNRPETEIAVVSHSGFLRCMLSNFDGAGSKSVRDDMRRLFANCELRTVVLGAAESEGNLDATWFHPEGLHQTGEGRLSGTPRGRPTDCPAVF